MNVWQVRTLIPLFLELKLLRQIFVLFPLDIGTDRSIVYKITRIAHFLLIQIRLLQHLVLKERVRGKDERDFETRFGFGCGEIRDVDINKVLQCSCITVCDQL